MTFLLSFFILKWEKKQIFPINSSDIIIPKNKIKMLRLSHPSPKRAGPEDYKFKKTESALEQTPISSFV